MTAQSMDPELITVLGTEAATALQRWAGLTDRKISVPVARWQRTGYTDAVLTTLYVTEKGAGSRLVVAKRLPAGQTTEPAAHRVAIQEAPPTFRGHLVEQAFEPILLPRGGALMFQELAGRSHAWRPLADLPTAHLPAACRELTRALIWDWNFDYTVEPAAIGEFLRAEVGPAAPAFDRSIWIRTAEDGPLLNPVLLFTESSLTPDGLVDVIVGKVHADLHDLNVLLKQHREHVEFDTFVLVDLMTYRSRGQLGRDLVRLLLSVTARLLTNLSASQRRLLLPVFVRPIGAAPGDLPPVVVETLRAVYDTAAELFSRLGDDVWHRQYLLTVIAHSLIFASYDNLGPARRWWFYRLAGYATRELLAELGHDLHPPDDIEPVSNPFDTTPANFRRPSTGMSAAPAGQPRPAASVTVRRTYTQSQKRRVCQGLGTDWIDLAKYLGIDSHERAEFAQGRKPHEVWEWLERQGRLHELAPALRVLGRADLAAILDSGDL